MTAPLPSPADKLRDLLKELAKVQIEYPRDLYETRRADFLRQIESKTGQVPA